VRIGVLVWPPYELAYLARGKGYTEEANIELVDYQTPAEMVRSYRFGLIDGMFVPSIFVLANADNLDSARIIYIINFSDGGDSLLARPGIDSIAELRGKRIGMEAGPLGAYMLARALHPHGLTREDVELVFVDTPDQKVSFESGLVDAVATYEPTRTQLLQTGANELFSSREIPLEIIDVIIVRQPVVNSHRKDLAIFVRSMNQALDIFHAEPEASAAIMTKRESISVREFLTAIDGMYLLSLEENHALLTGKDARFRDSLELQSDIMTEADIIADKPDVNNLIDTRVISEAAQ
jgi:NitT/TauT family transport system substrate-binding protein